MSNKALHLNPSTSTTTTGYTTWPPPVASISWFRKFITNRTMMLLISPLASSGASAFRSSMPSASTVKIQLIVRQIPPPVG